VYDGRQAQLFVNGFEAGNEIASGAIAEPGGPVTLGGGFRGLLDEVRIRGRAPLENEWRLDRPKKRRTPLPADAELRARYPMTKGCGYSLPDLSGNGNHGSINNARWTRTGIDAP